MNVGRFDTPVTFQRRAAGTDTTYNTRTGGWVGISLQGSPEVAEKFWANVTDGLPSKAESETQGIQVARNQTRIRIRYRDDITSEMRVIVHRETDEIYQIVGGPAYIGRKEMVEVMCERYIEKGST